MNRLYFILIALTIGAPTTTFSGPKEDLQQFRDFFTARFPAVPFNEFSNGVYAINKDARMAWMDMEEFPPYEEAIETGKALFETPFRNGKKYAGCFENKGMGIAHKYPYWDSKKKQAITLSLALNQCRTRNGEPELRYLQGNIASLLAYMAYTSRGNKISIHVPSNEKKAIESYLKGKQFYYQRRGQLNFSCATCHIQSSGLRIRSETLSPSLGHTTGWPAYRAKWGEAGTLHRRFIGCSKQMRAEEYEPQSEEYRNLEYFLTYMSNGLTINGPSYRK